jgi:hypothetical protein
MVRIFRLAKLSREVDLLGNAWGGHHGYEDDRLFFVDLNRKRESLHHVIGYGALRIRLHSRRHSARRTTADRTAAHRKSDQHHDVLYASKPEKRAASGPPEVMRKETQDIRCLYEPPT